MYLLISIILIVLTIWPLISTFHVKGFISFLLITYLLGFSLIVLTGEISGLLGTLNVKWVYLIIQLGELCISWIIWALYNKTKCDSLFRIFASISPRYLQINFKNSWWLWIYSFLIGIGYLVLAWLIVTVPPNNSDSMHTHLARIIYWLQQGSFKQLTSYSIFAKIYPFNAQLNVLWTILLTGTDKFAGFIQYIACLVTAISIYGLARLVGGTKKSSIFLSLLWLTYPLVVFQSTTTQFDLVITALFTIFLYFLFRFIKHKEILSLVFSSLAMGLCLGTKETVFLMGPGLLVTLLFLWIKDRTIYKHIISWIALVITFFLILGSYTYFNNIRYYGNPLGPQGHVYADSIGEVSVKEKFQYNPLRFLYQFISSDSLPLNFANQIQSLKKTAFTRIGFLSSIDLEGEQALKEPGEGFSFNNPPSFNEDMAWFGLAAFILITFGFFAAIIRYIKDKDPLVFIVLILTITFVFFEILLRPGWDRYQGRYFLLVIAIMTPFGIFLLNKKFLSKIIYFILISLSLVNFFFAVFSNELKPIIARRGVSQNITKLEYEFIPKNAIESITQKYSLKFLYRLYNDLPFEKSIENYSEEELATLGDQNHHLRILQAVNKFVPDNSKMGIMLVSGDFDYIFFGRRLIRKLININWNGQIFDKEWIRLQNLDYILIDHVSEIVEVPAYLELITSEDGWGLYKVNMHN